MEPRSTDLGVPAMTTIFAVVGERIDDPDRLLLLGSDGQYYQFVMPEEITMPVVPDETWVIDPNPTPIEDLTE